MSRRARALALAWLLVAGLGAEVLAVVGRPLTPVSYAGVARRTARRTTYRTAAASSYYYGAPATYGYTTTLPAGCTTVVRDGRSYRECGGSSYRPYYEGGNVVYVED
jgi:hypothetical protein